MVAIQKPNVEVHFTEVVAITEDSIIGKNGVTKEIDTIVCATGMGRPYSYAIAEQSPNKH